VIDLLNQIDVQIFYFINGTLQNNFFDWFMPFITKKEHWFPVWAVIVILMIWKGGKEGRLIILFVIPLILLSDQLSSSILKPLVGRIRPCNALENVNLLVNRSKAYSFPSAHAANFFALATYFGYYFRKYIWWFLLVSALVAYSRVYVGVHYPFDVLGGAVIGTICAFLITYLRKLFESFYGKFKSK
jgi:undecaprenyl-diphosphatase